MRHLVRSLKENFGVGLLRCANGRMTPIEPAMAGLKSLNVAFNLITEAVEKMT